MALAPVTRRAVAITDPSRKRVLATAAEMVRQGRAESVGSLQLLHEGPHAGEYAVRVVLLQTPAATERRRRGRLLPAAAVLGSLAAVVAAFAWLLTALSSLSLLGFCAILLAVLAAAVVGGRRGKGGNVTVISNINVRR